MAGTRHHIVPQFMLRGFSSRQTEKSAFTWLYRKDTEPIETNVTNVSVERHFYGKGQDAADDTITRLEESLAPVVQRLRTQIGPVESDDPASVVVHLSSRTKGLRDSFANVSDLMLDAMAERLSRPEIIQAVLLREVPRQVSKMLDERRVPAAQRRLIRPRLEVAMRQAITHGSGPLSRVAEGFFRNVQRKASELSRDGHISALASLVPSESERARYYRSLDWKVEMVERGSVTFRRNRVSVQNHGIHLSQFEL